MHDDIGGALASTAASSSSMSLSTMMNSASNNQTGTSSTLTDSTTRMESAADAASKQSLINYNRLLRQYKFLKSTNIKLTTSQHTNEQTKNYLFLNQLANNSNNNSKTLNDRVVDSTAHNTANTDEFNNKKLKLNDEKRHGYVNDDEEEDDDDEQEIFNEKMRLFKSNDPLEKMDHIDGSVDDDSHAATDQLLKEKVHEVSDVDMDSSSTKYINTE